ncbi:MAG: hypothetical protein U0736_12860 [Gemmataceae bacterium]
MVAVYRLAVLSCLVVTVPLAAVAPPAGPLPSRIAAWIEELGDDSFAVRQEATKRLRLAGQAAEKPLEKAVASSNDAEVLRRAKAILADFQWGIYPDTPENVVELIRGYQAAARGEKRPIIEKLIAAGPAGCRALARVAHAARATRSSARRCSPTSPPVWSRSVPALLEKGQLAALESVLDLGLAGDTCRRRPLRCVPPAARHAAGTHRRVGTTGEGGGGAEGRKRGAGVPLPRQRRPQTCPCCCGRGGAATNWSRRCSTRRRSGRSWPGEPTWLTPPSGRAPPATGPPTPGWRGIARRSPACSTTCGRARVRRSPTRGEVLPFARALFLNGRPADALDLLRHDATAARLRYEVLSARLQYAQAFAVVEEAVKAGEPTAPALELLQARTLALLGEKERAVAIVKKHAEAIKPGPLLPWLAELIEAEAVVSGRDAAFARAGKILALNTEAAWLQRLFGKLFERKTGERAHLVWVVLRDLDSAETPEKRLGRLRRLMEGTAPAAELTDFLDRAERKLGEKPGARPDENEAVGEVAVLGKRPERARTFFRQAGSVRGLVRLGDLLAERKEWLPAAVQFEAAYRKAIQPDIFTREERMQLRGDDEGESVPALALYLWGHALKQAGRTAEGDALVERAHLLPLGDIEMRFDLSRALSTRKHDAAAQREQDLLRRLGEPVLAEPTAYYTGEGLRAAAVAAARRKDWLAAADGFEQAFLRCLNPAMNFQRTQAYVLVPAFIYGQRARGLLAAGKVDDALTEITRSRGCAPGNVDLALTLVPELERAGRKKEADELFRAVQSAYAEVMRAFPRSAWALNQSAWLSAVCRRDLEQGLTLARKAVALAADNAAYQDTLAETLFQLGKKEEAIAAQKRAVALQPERPYFRRQLKRIETGDPKAARPAEEDE